MPGTLCFIRDLMAAVGVISAGFSGLVSIFRFFSASGVLGISSGA